ncbi:hypothetical protein BDN70DRAFT_881151 [Pholiota conissans]|uniref:XPG-I domain-containing protein n=1 Tax=Pholiota conissans TaxID=109636 RepID=A0A9P6CSL7_9AGAR|nr:hypothetical protein BDN70DRAFT_881151 [Pholiota conissans]
MGVAGLWDVLKPAAQTRSMTDLAIKEGFEANPDGKRGFRLGIDASIWFFHAEYGREGENPVLRTLFFRCATLMHTTFLPIFVFDGPKRPDIKRGKKINKTSNKLIPGMKQIVEAFGFEWRMAPGEAEAELAYLNRIGIIDGILSDDVDNFLFGATTVIRNSSNTLSGNRANPALNSAGKDDKNHTRVFRLEDITNHPDIRLTRGGMILIGLMSGGDYEQGGLMRFGVTTSHALAKCGFGDSLYEAARTLDREDLSEYLVMWRQELRDELRTNSKGRLGRKQGALAKSIPEDFPNIDVLLSYVCPITSESMGRESNNLKLTWSKEPNLAKLAETCEFYFEWGYKEAIIKRFRTVIWHSIVLRILRRAVLDLDEKSSVHTSVFATPRKPKTATYCGTPSKLIAKHFSSMALTTPQKHGSDSDSEDEDDGERLILRVHSTRNHTSTDGLLEYRLEISPKQLVRMTESGIKGIRVPEGPDEWASEGEGDEEGAPKKRGKAAPIDPETTLRVWMPACMVKLAEPQLVQEFEEKEEEKKLKKARKGMGRAPAKEKVPKEKAPRKPTKKAAAAAAAKSKAVQELLEDEDLFSSPARANNGPNLFSPSPVTKLKTATPRVAPIPMRSVAVSSEDEEGGNDSCDSDLPSRLLSKDLIPRANPPLPSTSSIPTISNTPITRTTSAFTSSPISTRVGIKDLTKKKPTATAAAPSLDLKSFYSVIQSGSSSITPKKPYDPSISHVNSSMSKEVIPDSEPPRAKARAENSRPALAPVEFGIRNRTAFPYPTATSQASSSQPSALPSLPSDEDDLPSWAKESTVKDTMFSSPSKRKSRKTTNSASESESTSHLKKSPRKKITHTSPQSNSQPISLSAAARPPRPEKPTGDVIELSDSDSPSDPVSRNLPPLMAARARAAARSTSRFGATATNSNRLISNDIIDLT